MPVVWALLALADGTVVSGDSDGCVQFWDGRLCVHEVRVETHAADVVRLRAFEELRRALLVEHRAALALPVEMRARDAATPALTLARNNESGSSRRRRCCTRAPSKRVVCLRLLPWKGCFSSESFSYC